MQFERWWRRIWQRNSVRLVVALASGAVFPVAFAPFNIWPVAVLALLVLHQILHRAQGTWQIIAVCFLFAIGKFGVGAYWIFVSLVSYAEVHLSVAIGLFVTFLVLTGTLFTVLAFFTTNSRNTTLNALVFASGLTVVEVLFSLPWPLSFPWLHLGYALIDTPLKIFAPMGGVWAVSFLGAFTAAALSHSVIGRWHALVVAVVVWCPGLFLSVSPSVDSEATSVALVQGNVPLADKWEKDGWRNSLVKYIWLTEMSPRTDLIVWPESAVPVDAYALEEDIFNAVQNFDGHLVFGALESRKLAGRSAVYNVVASVDQDGFNFFRKERLVPFGEYIPLRNVLGRFLQPVGYPMSSLTPSTSVQALPRVGDLTLGPAICYEVAYPNLVRKRVSNADLIVVLSEDSWLGNTTGPWQHLQVARMRALELNRPLVRATNDGVTATIDANGLVQNQLSRYREDVLVDSVLLPQDTTFFARFGLLPIALLIVIVLLVQLISQRSNPPQNT
ncbi:MAG: apolipoprotein N-acyltransferase [Gammaproteobacteria bacterium]|nr:apolipoprotein N-acyltransferase [Gammaproteobacteria bacterium]